MKRIYLILTAIMLAAFAVPAMAQTTFKTEDNGASIIYSIDDPADAKNEVAGCSNYTGDIFVPNAVTTLKMKRVNTTAGWTDIGTFQYSTITRVNLPSTIDDIQQGAFSDCPYLTYIDVDDNNETYLDINGVVYKYVTKRTGLWPNYTYVHLDVNGNETTDPAKYAYELIAVPGGMTGVNLHDNTITIAQCAFDGCQNIKELTIPSTIVNEIGKYAFAGCEFINITCLATTPPEVSGNPGDEGWGFQDMDANVVIYVPDESVTAYENHSDWREFEIQPISKLKTTFKVKAELTEVLVQGKVNTIKKISVTADNGKAFAGKPEGWTFTYQDGTPYTMEYTLSEGNKTIDITFPNNDNEAEGETLIQATGRYTLSVPAASVKDADNKKCDEDVFFWVIEERPVIQKEELHGVTLLINDSEENASLQYVNDKNEEKTITGSHTIGMTLYISDKVDESIDASNNLVYTTHKYYSANAIYNRTFKNNDWQAYYVPFVTKYDVTMANIVEFANIKSVTEYYDADKNVTWFYLTASTISEGTELNANTPYLVRSKHGNDIASIERNITLGTNSVIDIKANSNFVLDANNGAGSKYTFHGQYEKKKMDNDGLTYAMQGGVLKAPGDNSNLGAYRWYITITPAAGQSTSTFSFGRFDNEGTTGVEEVRTEDANVKGIYDLQGRKIDEITKPGLYIVDGVKVLVK